MKAKKTKPTKAKPKTAKKTVTKRAKVTNVREKFNKLREDLKKTPGCKPKLSDPDSLLHDCIKNRRLMTHSIPDFLKFVDISSSSDIPDPEKYYGNIFYSAGMKSTFKKTKLATYNGELKEFHLWERV